MTGAVHIIGAGLAGLAAATKLAPLHRVVVHEAARLAGGRCRSYFDPTLGLTIDNGNHLLLSGNVAAHRYLDRIGAQNALVGPEDCVFDFADMRDQSRWQVRPKWRPLAMVDLCTQSSCSRHECRRIPRWRKIAASRRRHDRIDNAASRSYLDASVGTGFRFRAEYQA